MRSPSLLLAALLLLTLAALGTSITTDEGHPAASRTGRSLQAACKPTSPARLRSFTCGAYPLAFGSMPPCGKPPPPITFRAGKFWASGKVLAIHGINWFGFNNAASMVDGLWAGWGKNQAWGDFASVVYQQKLLGFNTVRLPFRFTDIFELAPRNIRHGCPAASTSDIVRHATDPSFAAKAARKTPPRPLVPLPESAGTCNPSVPSGSTLARFLYVIHYYVQSGFYVVVDYHPTTKTDEPYIPKDPKLMVKFWTRLWRVIACSPRYESDLKGRLLLDLFNEPDIHNIGWNSGLGERLLGMMDALDKLTPKQNLYLIQGGGQHWFGFGYGDGFITDKRYAGVWSHPVFTWRGKIHDPNPFFRKLLTRPYRARVALAPHLYSASVILYTQFGPWQYVRHSLSWGYLSKVGYCHNKRCQKFPMVAGEMGSRFTNKSDIGYYRSLSKYMSNQGDARDGKHDAFSNWIWWSWNANSADTGGLTTDDFSAILWPKMHWLTRYFGLRPWWQ